MSHVWSRIYIITLVCLHDYLVDRLFICCVSGSTESYALMYVCLQPTKEPHKNTVTTKHTHQSTILNHEDVPPTNHVRRQVGGTGIKVPYITRHPPRSSGLRLFDLNTRKSSQSFNTLVVPRLTRPVFHTRLTYLTSLLVCLVVTWTDLSTVTDESSFPFSTFWNFGSLPVNENLPRDFRDVWIGTFLG